MSEPTNHQSPDEARGELAQVDLAIERLLSRMPLRRPSAMLDARIGAMIERRTTPWWWRALPLAAAAGFALAVGYVTGSWSTQARLQGALSGPGPLSVVDQHADDDGLSLVLRESSVRPAALAQPRSLDLGDAGSLQAADTLWIRTDRYFDPRRGVSVERSYPETWTLLGAPAAD
ncbi:MAG: hypothetical protein KF724_04230 [Phycisphaeraceae bacterium]|nr:hypothetical protein [Phycisphaeraceae bacterium]